MTNFDMPLFVRIMTNLDDSGKNKHQLWRDTGITYVHIHTIIKEIKVLGWIHCRKDGRKIHINLTKRGKEIKELFLKYNELLSISRL